MRPRDIRPPKAGSGEKTGQRTIRLSLLGCRFSFSRWWGIVCKEFLQVKRERLTFGMMVVLPLVQLIIFGFAIDMDPKNLPTGLLVAEHSEFSRSFIAAMRTTGYFALCEQLPDEKAARLALEQGRLQFVVNIPSDFSRKLARGERPALLVEADASDPSASSKAVHALEKLVASVTAKDLKGPLTALSAERQPFEVIVHNLYNPEGITRYNTVPGLIGVMLSMTMVMMTALSVTRERERGTMENLLSSPVLPLEVVSGKIVPYVFIGLIQTTIVLLAARVIFRIPFAGSLTAIYSATLLFITASLVMGIALSSVARNQLQAIQLTFFYFLPGVMLSGFMFPFSGMPKWAQFLGGLLPITYFNRMIRAIMLKGTSIFDLWPHIWPIMLFGLVFMLIAVKCYKKTLD